MRPAVVAERSTAVGRHVRSHLGVLHEVKEDALLGRILTIGDRDLEALVVHHRPRAHVPVLVDGVRGRAQRDVELVREDVELVTLGLDGEGLTDGWRELE